MFDAALAVGPGFKALSFHDLRRNLLRTLPAVFLILEFFFKPSFKKQKEVIRGLLSTITALVPDDYMQD
ncbi:hypothetical protein RJ640_021181 [Escallonia rubra]|uniref:Uncharacterized protein n=2 Tax=Escallonia rubra TaxID=112253 RepID=A0AA88QQ55_9ASTE|nr:hypothetical protein RJ640_021181 [Escallonia rubra]